MHGVKRVKQTPEALQAQKQKERAKIQEFTALTDDLLSRKRVQDYSEEAFKLTTRMLHINPEFYTIWNYRRTIMLKGLFVNNPPEKNNKLVADDLVMTMAALRSHPKVYWIWNHRRWCLSNVPLGPEEDNAWRKAAWDNELFVVEKILDTDARNFHAWNYRRYVLESMPVPRPEINELGYTSRKIGANFSNFSAWHQRSKVLPRLWEAGTLDERKSRESGENARFFFYPIFHTSPLQNSTWFAMPCIQSLQIRASGSITAGWSAQVSARVPWTCQIRTEFISTIISEPEKDLLLREIEAIRELLEEQPDSKWCMESTVHYGRLFIKLYPEDVAVAELRPKCLELLRELQELDPSRRQRYVDLAESM
ncbi:rab-protein geranylgeranyltransferase [Coprinopsis sp. MPI-PUGE-AT-0042]|nr:rab-protein geranylgeranyltransferase [Coprinopsis sp. MPI-PUGE-AT-0042]